MKLVPNAYGRKKVNDMASVMSREQIARGIFREAEHYMVCEGCGSILELRLFLVCPLCHAYLHDRMPSSVKRAAITLSGAPFSTGQEGQA